MKKSFKWYILSWALVLGLFNLLVFIIPAWPNAEKYNASFWIGYGVTTAAFIGQLICTWTALKGDTVKKTFFKLPMLSVSYGGLIATIIVSLLFMIVIPRTCWVSAIACAIVLVVSIIATLKAKVASDIALAVDQKIEKATSFIYGMREDSETLLARAKTDEEKAACKKVRDALKFSDPMSSAELDALEGEIKNQFGIFKDAITEGAKDVADEKCEELLTLITERNNKCKRLK